MSAEVAVRAAVVAALRGDAVLMAGLNGLFDGVPARASAPYGVVGDCIALDWGAKDVEGRELTMTVSLFDAGEAPSRLGGLLGRVDAVMRAVGPVEGWQVIAARLLRSRMGRTAGRDGWQALVDYRVRVVRL